MPKRDLTREFGERAIRCRSYGCMRNVRHYPYLNHDNVFCTQCNKDEGNMRAGTKFYWRQLMGCVRRMVW